MIKLTAEEKRAMCNKLASELPKIRELLAPPRRDSVICADCPASPSPALKTVRPK